MAWFTDRHCFLLAVIFYGLSTIYSVFLWRKGFRRDDWVNYGLLVVGVALHTLAMTKRGLSLHSCPVNNFYEAITFLLWTLGLACLVYSLLPRLKFLAAFTSPVLFTVGVFALMPALDPPHGPQPEFSGALRSLHAAMILQAYGAFGLAAVAASMFLVQQRDLKVHKLRALLSVLPSIQRLELVATRLVMVGFVLLTVGLVAGSQLPRKEGVSFFADTKVLWSGLLWLVYLEALVAHHFFGRSAKRFAVGIIIAFVFLLLTFGLTNKFSPMHQEEPQGTNSVVMLETFNIQRSTFNMLCRNHNGIVCSGLATPPHPGLLPRGGEGVRALIKRYFEGFYNPHSTFNAQRTATRERLSRGHERVLEHNLRG